MKSENLIAIQDYLPHRAPMLMVDAITELTNEKVVTFFEIKNDNVFVANNTFQEVGLIENAAQTCSAIVGQSFFIDQNEQIKEDVEVIGFISGIKKVTINQLPIVGNIINTISSLGTRFDTDDYTICTMLCKTFNEDILLFEAEINLFIQEKK
jgi:3-hydroxyacyl-[acyl-carrier-protein] dehydratase